MSTRISQQQLESYLWGTTTQLRWANDKSAANDFNLNIPRYVEPENDQVVLTVDAAMKQLRTSATAAFGAEEKPIGILKREGLLCS